MYDSAHGEYVKGASCDCVDPRLERYREKMEQYKKDLAQWEQEEKEKEELAEKIAIVCGTRVHGDGGKPVPLANGKFAPAYKCYPPELLGYAETTLKHLREAKQKSKSHQRYSADHYTYFNCGCEGTACPAWYSTKESCKCVCKSEDAALYNKKKIKAFTDYKSGRQAKWKGCGHEEPTGCRACLQAHHNQVQEDFEVLWAMIGGEGDEECFNWKNQD